MADAERQASVNKENDEEAASVKVQQSMQNSRAENDELDAIKVEQKKQDVPSPENVEEPAAVKEEQKKQDVPSPENVEEPAAVKEEQKKQDNQAPVKSDPIETKEAVSSAPIVVNATSAAQNRPSIYPDREDNLNYAIRDLAAFDITPLMDAKKIEETARDNIQFLLNRIYTLPREKNEWGVFAVMPDVVTDRNAKDGFRLPREKPVPKVKPMTRWEKFAKEKGIQKRKRGRMVWDESTKSWVPRYGYKSIKKNEEAANWAVEVKEGEDPNINPFAVRSAEKQLVKAKQERRELRNKVEAIGEKLPHGVTDFSQPSKKRLRGKEHLKEALRRAQISSASFGTHDKRAENEVVQKQLKRKKILERPAQQEKESSLKLLTRMEQGHISKEKAAKIGQVSTEKSNQAKKKMKEGEVKKSGKRSKNGRVRKKGRKGGAK